MAKERESYSDQVTDSLLASQLSQSDSDFVQERYRRTFSEGFGRDVLAHMLMKLGMFATLETEVDKINHNAAVGLLQSIGVITLASDGTVDPFRMKQITDALLALAVPMDQRQSQLKENQNG